jgi:carboxylesterase
MLEFGILCAAWLAFLVFISRKGTAHLVRPHTAVTLPVAFGLAAALLEAVPTTSVSAGFTLRTIIAVLAGVFAGRLFGKVAKLWAMGQERRGVKEPRLVHPFIALGMFLAGVPALWHVISANHAFLESELTPRDATTGIVHGGEEVRLEGAPPDGRAALLLHGLFGSPADFGELPKRMNAAGFSVFAPLLPGHGKKPDDLDAVWSADYRKAARAAFDELAAHHADVVVVGGSMGATLALGVAAERKPAALVLVSPYLGHFATPAWCPVEFDTLIGPASRVVRRVFVNADGRGPYYRSQSLHAIRQCRDLAAGLDTAAAKVACPTLLVVGDLDEAVPPASSIDWTAAHMKPAPRVVRLPQSGHPALLGPEAEQAFEAVLDFVN